jgi:hypothetical protein
MNIITEIDEDFRSTIADLLLTVKKQRGLVQT